jgi:hypothetical protein
MAILYNNIRFMSKKNEAEEQRMLLWEVLGIDECERLIAQAHEDIQKKKGKK